METDFPELFALPTSSMEMTGLNNAVTGSGADGLPFISSSTGVGWSGGGVSTQTFTGSYGGDISYYRVENTAAEWDVGNWTAMLGGFSEETLMPGSNWYNDANQKGAIYVPGTA